MPVQAIETPLGGVQSARTQEEAVKALKEIAKGNWEGGRRIIAETKDPLAAKLYYWLQYTSGPEDVSFAKLAHFIRKNPDWPGIRTMRLKAEKALSIADDNGRDVLVWFQDYPPLTAHGFDIYVGTLIERGQGGKAKELLANWWADTPLSREDQKYIYLKYSKYLDKQAHIRRLDTLLFAKQYTNARAVAGVLGADYQALVEARIALAEETGNVNALINRVPQYLQKDPGLLFERLSWRRRHDLDFAAMEILHDMPPMREVRNPDDWWRERHIIIRRLLEQGRYDSAYLLASKHGQTSGLSYAQAEWLTGFLALRFQKRPATAFQHFQEMYTKMEMPISKSRAAYWAGRAAEELGQEELSQHWYNKAAQHQTVYYGQLAAQELKLKGQLPRIAPPTIGPAELRTFNEAELVQAARLFHEAGLRQETTQFIQAFTDANETPHAFRFAAELAAQLEQYHDAIRIAKKATEKGMFLTAQSYPVITDQLRGVKVEPALVHALIRQESMFDFEARSPAGALGLMQVMPATAQAVARQTGLRHETSWLTSRPSHNIQIGATYMAQMLNRYKGSYPLAIAAYNAGPNRVDKWLKTYGDPRRSEVEMIDWIELIPIYETRNYVQRVMEGVYIYRLRLKER